MKKNILLSLLALLGARAFAQKVFKDPISDDKEPGTYVYPTDR